MEAFLFIKTPVVHTKEQSNYVRNFLISSNIIKIAFSCPHCEQMHVIDHKVLRMIFPNKKGVPATMCNVCKQYIYICVNAEYVTITN